MNQRTALHRMLLLAASFILVTTNSAAPGIAADPVSDGQWYVSALRLADAHKVTKGKGVIVAVIDTGVDPAHPDLAGSIVAGKDFTHEKPGDGLKDYNGHGTAMASLIAGHGRIQGVAPEATIMAVRSTTGGSGDSLANGEAVNWAVEHGATVISISQASQSGHQFLKEAVANAWRKNVVVIAASGNTPIDSRVGFPAAYDGALAVGGTGKDGNYSAAAATGSEVRISAPCDQISTARHNTRWEVGTGTSNSAALVAGAAALIRAKYPDMPARDVVNRLTATAVDKGPQGRDGETGFGLVNIVAALTANVPSLPPESVAPQDSTTPAPTDEPPLAAPGAQFPVGIAVVVVLGCLLVVVAAVLLVVRARRKRVQAGETGYRS